MNAKSVSGAANAGRPALILDAAHFERLQDIALSYSKIAPEVSEELLAEIERAEVRPSDKVPANVVNMGSEVTYRDDETGRSRTVRLVYPEDADISANRVSVMTPVGAALLGLAEGHQMDWESRGGETRSMTILEVAQPEAASGEVAVG